MDIFTVACCKNCIVSLEKTKNKRKRVRGWTIIFLYFFCRPRTHELNAQSNTYLLLCVILRCLFSSTLIGCSKFSTNQSARNQRSVVLCWKFSVHNRWPFQMIQLSNLLSLSVFNHDTTASGSLAYIRVLETSLGRFVTGSILVPRGLCKVLPNGWIINLE